jgi:hypothetical protein
VPGRGTGGTAKMRSRIQAAPLCCQCWPAVDLLIAMEFVVPET